jgi:hypothetical protein
MDAQFTSGCRLIWPMP